MKLDKEKEGVCMACTCPCDKHTEHSHPLKCEVCGHEHKDDGTCDCGCS